MTEIERIKMYPFILDEVIQLVLTLKLSLIISLIFLEIYQCFPLSESHHLILKMIV